MKALATAAAVSLILIVGCKDSRRLPSKSWSALPGPVTVDAVVLDEKSPPRQVALTMLGLLKKCRDVRDQGLSDPARAAEFDQTRNLIRQLAAPESIHALALQDPLKVIPKDVTVEQAVEIFTNPWPSLVSRYIDGLDPDSLVEQLTSSTNARVIVRADSPSDRKIVAEIENALQNQRGPDGQPMKPGTAAFERAVRDAAIDRGIVVPFETQIELRLVRENGFWRVSEIRLARATPSIATSSAPATDAGKPS